MCNASLNQSVLYLERGPTLCPSANLSLHEFTLYNTAKKQAQSTLFILKTIVLNLKQSWSHKRFSTVVGLISIYASMPWN